MDVLEKVVLKDDMPNWDLSTASVLGNFLRHQVMNCISSSNAQITSNDPFFALRYLSTFV
jgi:hypothetical protein